MKRCACYSKTLLVTALAGLSQLLPTAVVQAQDVVLEEVIVTARKRAESLQETPVAVTALNAEALRDAGVRNLADLNQVAPNIEVSTANGNAPLANIYIRGVGQRNSGANIDSGVGIYIDEVYVGRPDGALLDLNDIQSVQVLRGPQGTLFGKNTTGGALVFTTNRPVDEFEGSLGLRVGSHDRFDYDFVLNVPITDTLATRLSGVAIERDGYIENLFDGEDYLDEDRQSVIWQTAWAPTDSVNVLLNVNWAETEQLARPQKCEPVDGIEGWQAELFNALGIVPATGRTYNDFCVDAAEAGGGDINTVISDLGGNYHAENKGASLTVEWEINDNLSLKSITARRDTDAEQDDELDHTGIAFLHRTNTVHPFSRPSESEQFSQEIQLTGSAFDDRMQFVTGVYWFDEETEGRVDVNFLGPFDPAIGDLFFLNTSARELRADNEALALFTQVEWEFNENWRTTLGIRYTDETRRLELQRWVPNPASLDANGGVVTSIGGGLWAVQRPGFVYNPNFTFDPLEPQDPEEIDNSDVTPMASVQYLIDSGDIIDTGSLYFTYSEGFLSGGLSEGPSSTLEEFEPEEVTNYEFGFKLDLFDRRLRVNGALFYADYENRQLTTLVISELTNSPASATINAAESTIKGFELETTWLATDNWLINLNMTFNDGDIQEFEDQQLMSVDPDTPLTPGCTRSDLTIVTLENCPNDRSGENLPRLPEETYLLSAQYSWYSSIGVILPRVQLSLKKDIDYCFDSLSCDSGQWLEDEQFDLSARVTWVSNDEKWVAAIYGTNLTDEDYIVGGSALVESSGVGGVAGATPRMYGAEVKYSF